MLPTELDMEKSDVAIKKIMCLSVDSAVYSRGKYLLEILVELVVVR